MSQRSDFIKTNERHIKAPQKLNIKETFQKPIDRNKPFMCLKR